MELKTNISDNSHQKEMLYFHFSPSFRIHQELFENYIRGLLLSEFVICLSGFVFPVNILGNLTAEDAYGVFKGKVYI